MKLEDLKSAVLETEQAKEIISALSESSSKISLKGLYGSYSSVFMDTVMSELKGNHLILLSDKEEAAYFLNDFQSLNKMRPTYYFFLIRIKKRIN